MTKRSFTRYVEQELGRVPHFVIYALLEWTLIILLFADGFLAFVANEFAKFFELQIPCWLCTRIDHILVHRDQGFYYNDSICEGHRKDVSHLAYCHNHKKLSDIRKMCEACLLSFATEKESDCDTYKSLVGILHKDLECFVEDDHHQIQLSVQAARTWEETTGQVEKSNSIVLVSCSCCGVPLKMSSSSNSFPKGKNGSALAQAPTPSPRAPLRSDDRSLDLPHIRCTELKLMSDHDSELPEDEYGSQPPNRDSQCEFNVKTCHTLFAHILVYLYAFIHFPNLFKPSFFLFFGFSQPLTDSEDGICAAVKADPKAEGEDLADDANRTPLFGKGNRFFGIPLTDSATNSPRVAMRISRKSPLEKTSEYALESVEESTPNEAECDSILHRLKRQVRLDRKSLMALYMELDEERSASAVAANNAMAMITRLQAEKAAVQMEALQYQRMMEEQAEYDQEALEATYDLLAQREEELRLIEAEVEAYREKYGLLKEFAYESGDEGKGKNESGTSPGEPNSENTHNDQPKEENVEGALAESLKPLKGEKTYLLGRIKKLDKRSNLSANHLDEIGNTHRHTDTRTHKHTRISRKRAC